MALLAGLAVLLAGPALAANTLKSVSSTTHNGMVQLTFTFAEAPAAPQTFVTAAPPRIALDFAGTNNGLTHRSYPIDQGSTQSVSAVEAAGRTRVVVALSQPSAYATRIEGNQVIVSIGASVAGAAPAPAVAPAPVAAAAVPVASDARALAPVTPPPPSQRAYAKTLHNPDKALALADGNIITAVDFQRDAQGAGKLEIRFTKAGATAAMRTNGDTTTIDLGGANLAAPLAKRLDVTSYATPVRNINTRAVPGGARIEVDTRGVVQTASYQTGNQYVVEFARPTSNENGRLGAKQPVVYQGNRVTFNFQDIPVRSVLQLLADVSNLNIVASDSVGGNVTLRLVDVPWDQALDVILRAKSLAQRKNGNVVWIAPQTEISKFEENVADARQQQLNSAELVTDYIPINYGSAAQIAGLLAAGAQGGAGGGSTSAERGFLSPRGSVTFDTRTNTLLVNDVPEKVQEIRQLVSVLDRPVKQVLIESRLVIATDSFTRELGAKLGVSGFRTNPSGQRVVTGADQNDVASLNNSAVARDRVIAQNNIGLAAACAAGNCASFTPTLPPSVTFPGGLNVNLPSTTAGTSGFAVGVLGNGYMLNLELTAAQQEGRSETISQPRVVTANNQPAVIQQGQQIGYLTFSGGTGGAVQGNVQFKNAVLELNVTPTITSDDRVFMKLKVVKDAIASMIPNPGGGFVPQIDHREIDTSVLVDNGQTVVLGGVYEFTNTHDVKKVPFLGDIPLLGALFRNKIDKNSKAELLVFITPHILGETATVN